MLSGISSPGTMDDRDICNWSRRTILNARRLLEKKLGSWSFGNVEDPEQLSEADKHMMATDGVRKAMQKALWRPKRYFFPEIRGNLEKTLETMIREFEERFDGDSIIDMARKRAAIEACRREGVPLPVTDLYDEDNYERAPHSLKKAAGDGDKVCTELLKYAPAMELLSAKLADTIRASKSTSDPAASDTAMSHRAYSISMVSIMVSQALAQPGKIGLPSVEGSLDETLERMIAEIGEEN